MIISNSHRYVYVHLHKCAGTAVERALAPHLAWNDIILGSTPYGEKNQQLEKERFGLHKHSSAAECRNVIGRELWDAYFTFTTVRNPYSRAVSAFTYAERMMRSAIASHQFPLSRARDLGATGVFDRRFLGKAVLGKVAKTVTGRGVDSHPIFDWPMAEAFIDSRGSFTKFLKAPAARNAVALQPQYESLAVEVDGRRTIDLDSVIKVEELDAQWPALCEKLNVRCELTRENVSKKRNWRTYYDDREAAALVEELCAVDFDEFGYARLSED